MNLTILTNLLQATCVALECGETNLTYSLLVSTRAVAGLLQSGDAVELRKYYDTLDNIAGLARQKGCHDVANSVDTAVERILEVL